MIKSERGRVEINGSVMECLAEYGMLTKHFILSVPEEYRLMVMKALGNQMKLGIELSMKGGEENEELK